MYIYRLYDKNKRMLYVGKSADPIERLKNHFGSYNNYHDDDMWRVDIKYIDYAKIEEPNTSIYEIYYINKLNPPYNKISNFSSKKKIKDKKSKLVKLPELEFSELKDVGDIIDLDYYKNLYNKVDIYKEDAIKEFTHLDYKIYLDSVFEKISDKYKLPFYEMFKKNKRNALMYGLALFVGLKTGEIRTLNLEDYSYLTSSFFLKDENEGRQILIPEKLNEKVKEYVKELKDSGITEGPLIFTPSGRINPRTIQYVFKKKFSMTANKVRDVFIKTSENMDIEERIMLEHLDMAWNPNLKFYN